MPKEFFEYCTPDFEIQKKICDTCCYACITYLYQDLSTESLSDVDISTPLQIAHNAHTCNVGQALPPHASQTPPGIGPHMSTFDILYLLQYPFKNRTPCAIPFCVPMLVISSTRTMLLVTSAYSALVNLDSNFYHDSSSCESFLSPRRTGRLTKSVVI
jgi:hypothetical protein